MGHVDKREAHRAAIGGEGRVDGGQPRRVLGVVHLGPGRDQRQVQRRDAARVHRRRHAPVRSAQDTPVQREKGGVGIDVGTADRFRHDAVAPGGIGGRGRDEDRRDGGQRLGRALSLPDQPQFRLRRAQGFAHQRRFGPRPRLGHQRACLKYRQQAHRQKGHRQDKAQPKTQHFREPATGRAARGHAACVLDRLRTAPAAPSTPENIPSPSLRSRSSQSFWRARLARLFTVPTATPVISAASS